MAEIRKCVCSNYWWTVNLQRGWYFGYDSITERPRHQSTYHDAWYSKGETYSNGKRHYAIIYRMYSVDGAFDSFRCSFIGRLENINKSAAAKLVWQKIRKGE